MNDALIFMCLLLWSWS